MNCFPIFFFFFFFFANRDNFYVTNFKKLRGHIASGLLDKAYFITSKRKGIGRRLQKHQVVLPLKHKLHLLYGTMV